MKIEERQKTLITTLPMDAIKEVDSEESNVLDFVDRSLINLEHRDKNSSLSVEGPLNFLQYIEKQRNRVETSNTQFNDNSISAIID